MTACNTVYGVKACDESRCDNCPMQNNYHKEDADVPDEDM